MPLRFTVLASGSAGNASLVEADGRALLIDAGLGPRQLASRMAAVGASWERVDAVVLTHTHGDHWKDRTFAHVLRRRVPVYCHPSHQDGLRSGGLAFVRLESARLVRPYDGGAAFEPLRGVRCRAVAVCHDAEETFGFRIDYHDPLLGRDVSLGYLADLGCCPAELAAAVGGVDVLALEFNHDVGLEYASGRSAYLIARVLGEAGHLSNEQAGAFVAALLGHPEAGRLRCLIQLHLSRECNHPDLALAAAHAALGDRVKQVCVVTAEQGRPAPTVVVGHGHPPKGSAVPPARRPARAATRAGRQPWLPGWSA